MAHQNIGLGSTNESLNSQHSYMASILSGLIGILTEIVVVVPHGIDQTTSNQQQHLNVAKVVKCRSLQVKK